MTVHNTEYDKEVPLPKYIQAKIDMLEDEFLLKLSFREIEWFRTLKTEAEVDQYARKLISEKL